MRLHPARPARPAKRTAPQMATPGSGTAAPAAIGSDANVIDADPPGPSLAILIRSLMAGPSRISYVPRIPGFQIWPGRTHRPTSSVNPGSFSSIAGRAHVEALICCQLVVAGISATQASEL